MRLNYVIILLTTSVLSSCVALPDDQQTSHRTINNKSITKREFPQYSLVQTFQNVWHVGRPVRQMTLWGAFTYYGTLATFGLIDHCHLCVANNQDPPGTNCQDSLESLAKNIAVTVMAGVGISYTNGWSGKEMNIRLYMRAILMVLLKIFLILTLILLMIWKQNMSILIVLIITTLWYIQNQNYIRWRAI